MTRIIAADDQTDILEALRLLLKREGIAMVPASSPAGVLSALEQEDFDAALIDLELRARHHPRRRGPRSALAAPGARSRPAGGGDDGLGQRGRRGGGDAPRRPRLRAEALGQCPAGGDAAHADRARARPAAKPPAGRGELAPARKRPADDRAVRRDAGGPPGAGEGRAQRGERADHGRARHGARRWWRATFTPPRSAPASRS